MSQLSESLQSKLDALISECSLDQWRQQILERARPAVLLPVEPVDNAPVGASRLGGTPDLPNGWDWPVADPDEEYAEDDPQYLTFLAQINLADVPSGIDGLPAKGWLFIFAVAEDADDNPNAVLFYDGPATELSRRPEPQEGTYADDCMDEAFGILAIKEFVPAASLPDHCEWAEDRETFVNEGHADNYMDLRSALLKYDDQKEPVSRLGGHLYTPHGGEADDDEWQLIAQIESNFSGETEMNFWDAGCQQVFAKSLTPVDDRIPETRATIFSM